MTDQELQKYVQDQLAQGIDPAVLRMALEAEGVSADQITQALAGKMHSPAIQVPKPQGVPAPVSIVAEPAPVIASPIAVVPTKKGFFAHKAIIISVLVILALAAGGAYAYTTLMLTPEKVTQKMLANFAEINSLDYEVSIKGEVKESGDLSYSGELQVNGTSDIRDPNDPRASFLVDFAADDELNFGLEARMLNRTGYFKLNKLPGILTSGIPDIMGQWVKVDIDDLEEQTGEDTEALKETLTPDQIQQISDAYVKYPMVKMSERIGTETLDNTTTYHYKFTPDKTSALSFWKEVIRILYTENEGYGDDIDEIFDEVFKMVDIPTGDIWIGKKDFLPRRVTFTMNITNSQYPSTVKLDFDLKLKNFNMPSQIEAPADAREFEEFYQEVMGEPFVSSEIKADDSKRLADARQIQTALELYFNDNGMYPPAKSGQPDPDVKASNQIGISFKDYLFEYPEYLPHTGGVAACGDNKAYVYARPTPANYTLTFCLESAIGGYEPGDHTASPAGIN